ncbi:hypothetical protein [Streptomyces sp. NPDC058373]|uniref:hypothetical protein n=1 Tax=Streptomyces sp. NPDC058373 TaxID=3346465 RepID=UPI00364C79D9
MATRGRVPGDDARLALPGERGLRHRLLDGHQPPGDHQQEGHAAFLRRRRGQLRRPVHDHLAQGRDPVRELLLRHPGGLRVPRLQQPAHLPVELWP